MFVDTDGSSVSQTRQRTTTVQEAGGTTTHVTEPIVTETQTKPTTTGRLIKIF